MRLTSKRVWAEPARRDGVAMQGAPPAKSCAWERRRLEPFKHCQT